MTAKKRRKKTWRKGRRGKVLLGGAAMFCSPGVFFSPPLCFSPLHLPHRGDLDLEECAPCSVSGENEGGERKRNSPTFQPHLHVQFLSLSLQRRAEVEEWSYLSVCRRVMGSACFGDVCRSSCNNITSFYKRQHEKFFPLCWQACVWSILTQKWTQWTRSIFSMLQTCSLWKWQTFYSCFSCTVYVWAVGLRHDTWT